MIGSIAEGRYLTAAQAAPILDYFNIDENTIIGRDPIEVQYQGITYLIFEGDYAFPAPSATRPDGIHFVYQPSGEEIETYISPPPEPDYMETVSKGIGVLGLGIVAYLIVSVLKIFRK